jgi:rhodanese-related sulfurtransferase
MGEDRTRTTIQDLLEAARHRLRRVGPREARDAVASGAVLIDIRADHQRERDGAIPEAHVVARNVLEWRLDPASGACDLSLAADLDRQVILFCDEGYQSSLAASTLQDLGFRNATDLVGGFQAWRAAGLSVVPPRDP